MDNNQKIMLGKVSLEELKVMAKTYPSASLNIAYGEGVLVGIDRAKEKFKSEAQAQREYIERLEMALKKIAEGEVRTTHKIDKCAHGAYGYENCDMCYIEFAELTLASKPKDIV